MSTAVHTPGTNRAVVVIPARHGSTRLPAKALADIGGRPMVAHVLDRVRCARRVDRALVATDDPRIASAVRAHCGEVVMTSPGCATGTDRVAEASAHLDADVVINVQGDEPLVDPSTIDALVGAMDDPDVQVATVSAPYLADRNDPARVKVVTDARGRALYFSRSPVPSAGPMRLHVGLYAFRPVALRRFASLPRGPLERAERLEQLRFLEHGVAMVVVEVRRCHPSVDTAADLDRVRRLLAA